jgi:hypothetical protein
MLYFSASENVWKDNFVVLERIICCITGVHDHSEDFPVHICAPVSGRLVLTGHRLESLYKDTSQPLWIYATGLEAKTTNRLPILICYMREGRKRTYRGSATRSFTHGRKAHFWSKD